MSKWSQVRCNCHNRLPLPKSSWWDKPYRHGCPQKLSPKKKREIEAWENNIEGVYECGHRDGMLVQFGSINIIKLGYAIEKVFANDFLFEIYPRVGDWRNYFSSNFDGELRISPEEAELWLMEAIELEQAFLSQKNLSYDKVRQILNILFYREAKSDRALDCHFETIKAMKFTRAVEFLNNLDDMGIS
ncbi:MAG: hypothetical protein AAFO95_12435 [Cyanobacteria bacterium J06600_6]